MTGRPGPACPGLTGDERSLGHGHPMDQPLFWSAMLGVAVLGAVARLTGRHALRSRRAVRVPPQLLAVAALAALALVFHCAAMFFAPWTDAVPGLQSPGEAVRGMGPASRWAYAVPAAVLVLALLRVWWPALLVLAATLTGVGVTMYGPYPLATHLAWLAALIVVGVLIPTVLLGVRRAEPGVSTAVA